MARALIAAFFGFAALSAPAYGAICAPPGLVHVTATNVSPGIPPGSFGAQPRDYYRIGHDKMRIEEALDAPNEIHGLLIVAEPNIWLINLYNNTGKHGVDPGPTFNAKAPVFGVKLSPKLMDLEFGCEADFIAANAPKPERQERVGNETFDVYRVDDGGDLVELLERPKSGIPAYARLYRQGSLLIAVRYDLYATGLPNDPSLFVPPANIHYTEGEQH